MIIPFLYDNSYQFISMTVLVETVIDTSHMDGEAGYEIA
jgi:hypothetical protein